MSAINNVKIYDMDHEKRGIALVININKYDSIVKEKESKKRVWSQEDVENLTNTLEYLEFDLNKVENLTKTELENLLKEQAEKSHENYDCLLCVVMSHGIDDHILTRDNQLISFVDIMAPFKSSPTLLNKPKMFFFQACRGENELKSFYWKKPPPISVSRISSASSTTPIQQHTDLNKFPILPPIQSNISEYESDLLVYYSTLPNHLSWSRDAEEGTIFIKSVCDVFMDAYKNIPNNLSLAQMVNKINDELSSKVVQIDSDDGQKEIIQVAVHSTTMKGEVYFLPKNLLHGEYIEYLKRENRTNNEEFQFYYITRKLKRFIQIDREKLNDNNNKNFLIVHSEEEFNQKFQEQSNNNSKSLHYLKDENQHLIWQKSRGLISDLNGYIINKEEFCLLIDEEEILNGNEKVLIISAEPGMGKSTILDSLTQLSNSSHFFLKIVLNSFTEVLDKLQKKAIDYKDNNALDFILTKRLRKSNHQLENKLLKHLAKEEKLIIMFDGVDEVSDYKEQVKRLIKSLNENNKLKKILITTRNHLKQELENNFYTISYNLNHFNTQDQIKFLVKYCQQTQQTFNEKKAVELITKIKSSLTNNIDKFIGIPLQTKMIADIYLNKLNLDDIKINNISDFYHEFVETKFKINLKEKKGIGYESNRRLYEREKKLFYEEHIQFSSQLLLKTTKKDTLEVDEIIDILDFGLIVDLRNEIPMFLHQSYAEYFVAKMALNKINQNINDEELSQVLKNKEFFLVRKFLNDLEIKVETSTEEQQHISVNYKEEITNCCIENLPNILIYLIDIKSADIKSANLFLLMATCNGNKEIVELLLQKGIDLGQKDFYGTNVLEVAYEKVSEENNEATRNNFIEIIKLLIQTNGIDIHQKFGFGKRDTLLHYASQKGHRDIAEILIQKGIEINQTNDRGYTALYLASSYGHKDIVELLIQQEEIEIDQVFWSATANGNLDILELLILEGILNIEKEGWRALDTACYFSHFNIVKMLIEKKFIDLSQNNEYGQNALHLAFGYDPFEIDKEYIHIVSFGYGHREIVEYLIQKEEININQTDCNGDTPLHLASLRGYYFSVDILIQKGIDDINKTNKNGQNALHLASIRGHKDIVQLLIEKEIDINKTNKNGENALYLASYYGQKEIAELLIEKGIDNINQTNENGFTALHWASKYGHLEIVKLLKQRGIDINQATKSGYTALHLASNYGNKEIIKFLIEQKPIDIKRTTNNGRTALHLASTKGHIHVDLNQTDENDDNSAIYRTAKEDYKEIVELLIQKGIDINQTTNNGYTALHYASANSHKDIVEILIKAKEIDINQKDKDGRTALHLASCYANKEIVQILIKKEFKTLKELTNKGNSALTCACACGKKEIVKYLIQLGVNINHINKEGKNALYYASEEGHKEIVELLIQKGIEINQTIASNKS